MTRLVIFLLMLASIIGVLALNSFKEGPINNAPFNFLNVKNKFIAKKAEVAALRRGDAKKKYGEAAAQKKEVEQKAPTILLDTPELVSGHKLYKKCISCHGKMGNGKKAQKAPKISGQYEWYLIKQLQDMQAKKRINKVMYPFIRKLSAEEIKNLSHYLSKLAW